MAKRICYIISDTPPFYMLWESNISFKDNLTIEQKQQEIALMHDEFENIFPGKRVLEISSKSLQHGGVDLSAFNLLKYVPSLKKHISVECIYQASKVFENDQQFIDLLDVTSKQAKKDLRIATSGKVIRYEFEGKVYPSTPKTAFYNYLYISALLENENKADVLTKYDAFTDIEFNPVTGSNCQALASAIYVSLARNSLIHCAQDWNLFLNQVYYGKGV